MSRPDIYDPDPFAPVTGVAVARSGAFTEGETTTVAVSIYDAIDVTDRLQVTGGLRWERYDTQYVAVSATGERTTDASAEDSLVSGKVGLLYKLTDHGNAYVSFGHAVTPPGTAELHAQHAAEQPEQPERGSAGVDESRGREQVGLLRRPPRRSPERSSTP